jgi:hypothetical protein
MYKWLRNFDNWQTPVYIWLVSVNVLFLTKGFAQIPTLNTKPNVNTNMPIENRSPIKSPNPPISSGKMAPPMIAVQRIPAKEP